MSLAPNPPPSFDPDRRRLLRLTLLAPLMTPSAPAIARSRAPHVVVMGAGAFGGWTALQLVRRRARVTLVDAWGPAHARASSGGETRVIRGVYGERVYVDMAVRAFELWRDHERRIRLKLYRRLGAMWMVRGEGEVERRAIPMLKDAGLRAEELTPAAAARRYPQVRFDDVRWVLYEAEAGYLLARRSCESVLEMFRAEGGEYRELHAQLGPIAGHELQGLRLSDGSELRADAYVFACGPWLAEVFPDILGQTVKATRQEVFFFGTPAGDARFTEQQLPVWIDHGTRLFYGIPGNLWRGFKVADDTRGPAMNPTTDERTITPGALELARSLLSARFPALASAPLVDARVCQYENSPDGHFIFDRHPEAKNVWIAGGGSGHGFKFGPAIGERVAALVLGRAKVDPFFGLARLTATMAAARPGHP
jgi:glycine/D-amino acid oxidase-like deaminating enzyme